MLFKNAGLVVCEIVVEIVLMEDALKLKQLKLG
jgi:hypothetical protein